MISQVGGAREIFQRQTNAGVGLDKKPPGRLGAEQGEAATAEAPAVESKNGVATAIATGSFSESGFHYLISL